MGAGKSTVGPHLAKSLGWNFIDLDDEIVRERQESIAEIFDSAGEAGFRDMERNALARALLLENIVLALGGGAVETAANLQSIQQDEQTLTLYLEAPLEILIARCEQQQLQPGSVRRPVLERRAELAERFQRRRPLYELADLTVDTTGKTLDELVVSIANRLNLSKWNAGRPLKVSNR
ncbi:MAG: shikimate kinase [Acidobacteriaceae bacterium]